MGLVLIIHVLSTARLSGSSYVRVRAGHTTWPSTTQTLGLPAIAASVLAGSVADDPGLPSTHSQSLPNSLLSVVLAAGFGNTRSAVRSGCNSHPWHIFSQTLRQQTIIIILRQRSTSRARQDQSFWTAAHRRRPRHSMTLPLAGWTSRTHAVVSVTRAHVEPRSCAYVSA